jgi:dUTP pyrophosphatase
MQTLRFKRLRDDTSDIPLPEYATAHSSGMDLRCSEAITLEPGVVTLVPTSLAVEIPEGCEGQIRPRSGLALKHAVTCLNSPGTIDADYRGEVKIIMFNHGTAPVSFERGSRIAQLIVSRYERVEVAQAEELADTVRSVRGFGHSGVA